MSDRAFLPSVPTVILRAEQGTAHCFPHSASGEIIDAAEDLGYTEIEEKHDSIEANDPDGFRVVIAEQ